MTVAPLVPLAEAAAFTLGCWVLRARRHDPDRVFVALVALTVALVLALLILQTPDGTTDGVALDPEGVSLDLDRSGRGA